jgi:predicted alpha/beta superfamily hydrolase
MRATFTLPDPQTGTTYHLYAEATADESADATPAVLVMDGDDQFKAAVKGYHRARRDGRVPPLVLVGVGYGASYTKPGNFRVRDYTPTAISTETGSGGADGFLAFLQETLWPEIARRYRVREDVRGIAGHSLGSLLVVQALLQPPLFFNRLLASAPSLWWDDKAVICAAQKVQRTGVARPARLYLSVGEEDTTSMTTDLEQFEQQLSAAPFPSLEVITQRFPGRDHYNVLEDAYAAGLTSLFGADSSQLPTEFQKGT